MYNKIAINLLAGALCYAGKDEGTLECQNYNYIQGSSVPGSAAA